MTYNPDNWIILKIDQSSNGIADPLYKVLAGWSGGYLDGDSWRMNSGIDKIIEHKGSYEFHGYSGSVYSCNKNAERPSHAMAPLGKLLAMDDIEMVKATEIL